MAFLLWSLDSAIRLKQELTFPLNKGSSLSVSFPSGALCSFSAAIFEFAIWVAFCFPCPSYDTDFFSRNWSEVYRCSAAARQTANHVAFLGFRAPFCCPPSFSRTLLGLDYRLRFSASPRSTLERQGTISLCNRLFNFSLLDAVLSTFSRKYFVFLILYIRRRSVRVFGPKGGVDFLQVNSRLISFLSQFMRPFLAVLGSSSFRGDDQKGIFPCR